MSRHISASIVVAGDPVLLAGFRRRVNELLDSDADTPYRELHTAGRLDYRIKAPGVPYPQIVAASSEFPDLVVEVAWENPAGGAGGSAKIQAGKLAEQAADRPVASAVACELRVERDGTLEFAVACRRQRRGEWIGYALTASHHAFIRFEAGVDGDVLTASDGVEPEWAERWTIHGGEAAYARLDQRERIDDALFGEFDRIANDFADEWIWFSAAPEEETAVERHRYVAYGFKINAANVRSIKLKTILRETPEGGLAFELTDPEARRVAAALARYWLRQERH
jgi:hypothetical protein